MTFDADATHVDTPVAEAFAARRGVCQDYAQIMLAGLRGLGVPAAYVSGFLRTVPPPGRPRLVGADAMHAWVRVWTGRDSGWMDYDPTNACTVGADHVEVGAGRDYADCAPVTGVLRLDGSQSTGHSVDMEPV
jgi:transglutaminase-like putative cysteine protease